MAVVFALRLVLDECRRTFSRTGGLRGSPACIRGKGNCVVRRSVGKPAGGCYNVPHRSLGSIRIIVWLPESEYLPHPLHVHVPVILEFSGNLFLLLHTSKYS